MKKVWMSIMAMSLSLSLTACGPESTPIGVDLTNQPGTPVAEGGGSTPATGGPAAKPDATPVEVNDASDRQASNTQTSNTGSTSSPSSGGAPAPVPVMSETTNPDSGLTLTLESARANFTGIGQVSQLSLTLKDKDGKTVPLKDPVTWRSSDESSFTVDKDGRVTVQTKEGTAIISARIAALDIEGKVTLMVEPVVSSSGGGGGGSSSSSSSDASDSGDSVDVPTITWVSVASGSIGDTILIVGTNLRTTTSVVINDAEAEFEVLGDTLLSVQIPADAKSSGVFRVTTEEGNVTLSEKFGVDNASDAAAR